MRKLFIMAALVAPTLGGGQTAAQRATTSAVEQCEAMGYRKGTELFLACANQQIAIEHDSNVRRSNALAALGRQISNPNAPTVNVYSQ
jgi:hypothetical protein